MKIEIHPEIQDVQMNSLQLDQAIIGLGPILHERWRPEPDRPGVIVGQWGEDNSSYEIVVPHQIRDLVINAQMTLRMRHTALMVMRKKCEQTIAKAIADKKSSEEWIERIWGYGP